MAAVRPQFPGIAQKLRKNPVRTAARQPHPNAYKRRSCPSSFGTPRPGVGGRASFPLKSWRKLAAAHMSWPPV